MLFRSMGDTAAELGLGEIIELVPRALDPKNLFGVLRSQPHLIATGDRAVTQRVDATV